jgi:phage major head subunit gpT-like protein
MSFQRESGVYSIDKFVTIGAATVVVIGSGLWGMRTWAHQSLDRDSLEAPWIVAARAQDGGTRRVDRAFSEPVASKEVQDAVVRWRRDNAR